MSHAESRAMGGGVSSGGLDVGLPSMGKRWGRDPRLHAGVCVEQRAVGVDILFPSEESGKRNSCWVPSHLSGNGGDTHLKGNQWLGGLTCVDSGC